MKNLVNNNIEGTLNNKPAKKLRDNPTKSFSEKSLLNDINDIILRTEKVRDNLHKSYREVNLLNDINDIILRSDNVNDLFSQVCECIVNSGGYKLAWICVQPPGNSTEKIIPLVAYGVTEYVAQLNIDPCNPVHQSGPTMTALNAGKTTITNNLHKVEYFKPWADGAMQYGIAASLGLSLMFDDGQAGALNIYSGEPDAFDEHEVSILERLAKNISLAVRHIRSEQEKEKTKYLLRERVKELTTIYEVSKIIQNEQLSLDEMLSRVVTVLPLGWQYPEICAAKIFYNGKSYTTPNYVSSKQKLSAPFNLADGSYGFIHVLYTEERPDEDEGAFYKEERILLNSVAQTIEINCNKYLQKKALVQSEARFRTAFENAAIGMALISSQGSFLMVNQELCNMLGYTKDELLAIKFQQIIHSDDLENDIYAIKRISKGLTDSYRSEQRYIHKNGSTVWISVNVAVVRNEAGKATYHIAQIENITARKQSQEALVRSEANMSTIFNSTDIGYLLLSPSFRVEAFNRRMQEDHEFITGKSLKENDYFHDHLSDERQHEIAIMLDMLVKELKPFEYVLAAGQGDEEKWYKIKGDPVTDKSAVLGVCISAYDITHERKRQQEKELMISDLLQRNSDLQQFAQIVSHNIRGPLSTILGIGALLKEEIDENERNYLTNGIIASSERMDVVVKDLNRILQIKQGPREETEEVQFDDLMEELHESLSRQIHESRAVIEGDFSQVKSLVTVRSFLSNIFYHLVANSIKYRRPGITPEISVWTELQPDAISIYIKDNGLGIDLKKHRNKLFELYRRIDLKVEGRGLGLFLVKTQVEVLNGKVDVESTPDSGSTFIITLPRLG